ncbi:polyketide cyclase [Jannaschia sp. EhC01]|nr:polyketide cyclase [Jannaschia sp. EhC01]
MRGFDPKWQDVPHYIIGITKEIWEDRRIGALITLYADGLIVRSPASVVEDNTNVIAATMATLAEFPDRELFGEDVIWAETPDFATDTSEAFLSSHRLICTATHTGAGVYGAPTGKRLTYRILADCAIRDGAVYDEWLVRDQAAIVAQMGGDIVGWTRDLIAKEGGAGACMPPLTPDTDVPGPYTGRGNDNEWGARYADTLRAIMNAGFDVIPARYDRGIAAEYPGDATALGWLQVDQFWMGLRAAFPDATFSVDHVVGREDPLMPPRAAVRWSLHGTHSGWGRFGRPTGAEVYVMGISHAEFGPFAGAGPWGEATIRREFTLIDDTAIWKQILLKTGAHP